MSPARGPRTVTEALPGLRRTMGRFLPHLRGERRRIESDVIARLLSEEVASWRERGDWMKLKCIELLIVVGAGAARAAAFLSFSDCGP